MTKEKSKVREIIEKYVIKDPKGKCRVRLMHENDFDKLEIDLAEEMRRFGNKRYEDGIRFGMKVGK